MSLDRQNPTRSRGAWALAALLLALLPSAGRSTASAQDAPSAGDTAAARALFQQGMAAIDGGDYATGADRLSRSLEVRDSVVVRANYALALIELGRLVEASEHLRTVQRATEPGTDAHQLASAQLSSIEPRLGSLQIDVLGPTDGTDVRVDGRTVPSAALGVPQPVDPGRRVVTLHRGDLELASQSIIVSSGHPRTVTLTAPPPTAEELAEAEMANPRVIERERIIVREDGGGVEEEAWFWVLVSGLAVGAIVGVVVAVLLAGQGGGDYEEGSSRNTFLTLVEVP